MLQFVVSHLKRWRFHSVTSLRFFFYAGIIFSELSTRTSLFRGYGKWMPVLSKNLYPFLPDFILTFEFIAASHYIFMFACLLSAISVLPKLSSAIAAVAGSCYFILYYSLGDPTHHDHLLLQVLWVFAIFENFKSYTSKDFIQTVRIMFVAVFFSAGLMKLRNLGLAWFEEETLTDFLLRQRFYSHLRLNTDVIDANLLALQYVHYFKYLYFMVLPLELLSPLCLFRRTRLLIWTFAIMQIAAAYIFYAVFDEYVGIYIFWLISRQKMIHPQ